MQRQGLKRRPCLCTPSPLHPNNVANTAHVAPGTCSKPPSLRCAPVSSLDDSDHFFDNQLTSVAALRSLIGFRRNADRLPSGTLIDFPRIRRLGKPETFDFLGFKHICGKTKKGRFLVLRQTVRKRMQAKLLAVKTELRRRMHDPVPEVGEWLKSVVGGHIRYFGVPGNRYALAHFRFTVSNLWHRTLCRRSQHGRVLWERMNRLIRRWLPPARICHPYPSRRLRVTT
jgi:hypothetical protein